MDSSRFDTLVKQLFLLRSRREGLRLLLAGLIAGSGNLGGQQAGANDGGKKKGKRMKRNRKKKGKKKRPSRPCGPGGCADVGESCCVDPLPGGRPCCRQCCFRESGLLACEVNPKPECRSDDPTCCGVKGVLCAGDCDCCGTLICRGDGGCGECSDFGEACAVDDDCCFEADECAILVEDCGVQGRVCCSPRGATCDPAHGNCDCCFPFKCQVDGTCNCIVTPDDRPCLFDRDCCYPAVCGDGGGGLGHNVCCLPTGAVCTQRDNCCDGNVCRIEAGSNFGECRAPAPTCAPENDRCTLPPVLTMIPCGKDAATGADCFCSGGVCAVESGCLACASNADCERLPFFGAGARCVACPQCQPGSGLTTRCVKPCSPG